MSQDHPGSLWVGLGVVASKLGEARGLHKDEISHAYLGGLMRNTGVLLFFHLQTEAYKKLLDEGRQSLEGLDAIRMIRRAMQFENLESKRFGMGHNDRWPYRPVDATHLQIEFKH